ncbi:probable protein phosphatase 2C 9 isoform X3 [Eucalyptus grandis]|uniref:probable protein phosphatase 2C 9 isoform X3 n=1 Tax=Eucalyptus grandis TaxID=71139 RepID=UPI00192EC3EB|nr:probable protein phosphatase 2C 9 isoform X3 [Eucalyptus grandis]
MARLCCFNPQHAGAQSSTSGKGRNIEGLIKYGFSLVKGKANHPMEDYHVAKFMQKKGHELGLFAIYDGHLGDKVPVYLQKHLFSNILKEEEFWVNPNRSISKAYEKTDQAILSNSSGLGRGGSTAVTVILINGQQLLVANVGDSRAVLSRGGRALQMSIDHEPSTERGSIEHRGGFVSNMPDVCCFGVVENFIFSKNEKVTCLSMLHELTMRELLLVMGYQNSQPWLVVLYPCFS